MDSIQVKRVYEAPSSGDGLRILVDRLWPRGLSRDKAALDHWFKDLAPSHELRRWYGHDPEKWMDFQRRYLAELHQAAPESLSLLKHWINERRLLTFLFSARNLERNNAVALKVFLEEGLLF